MLGLVQSYNIKDIMKLISKNLSVRDLRLSTNSSPMLLLRHDVDSSIVAANEFSRILLKFDIQSNFFIRANSDIYNVLGKQSSEIVKEISQFHDIGLHIESPINQNSNLEFKENIKVGREILESIIKKSIISVSWHRPSPLDLGKSETSEGLINLYSKLYFHKYQYLSDSANSWDDNKMQILEKNLTSSKRTQLLIHPEWWVYEGLKGKSFQNSILRQLLQIENEINTENKYFGQTFKIDNLFSNNKVEQITDV